MLHASTQQLNKTAGINGAYSTAMNVSQTLALKGQHVLVPKLGQNGGGSDVFVRTVGGAWRSARVWNTAGAHLLYLWPLCQFESAVFWLYTNPDDEKYYLRSVNATSAVTQYTFSLGGDGDKCAYAASNRAILTVQQVEYTATRFCLQLVLFAACTTVSNTWRYRSKSTALDLLHMKSTRRAPPSA